MLKHIYQVEDYDDIFKNYNRVTDDLNDNGEDNNTKNNYATILGTFLSNGGVAKGKKRIGLEDIKAD